MVWNFFQEFFVKPIELRSGFNPINTLTYAAIMLFIAFVIVYPLFSRKGVKFNVRFALSVLPYILLGTSLRVVEDLRILPRSGNPLNPWYFVVTPGIWILVGFLTISCLIASLLLARKLNQDYTKIFGWLGLILALPFFVFVLLHFKELIGFFGVLALTAIIVFLLIKFFSWKKINSALMKSDYNKLVLGAQTLDASATFLSLQFFSCTEQHFLPLFLIKIFSPAIFIVIKVALVLLILYFLDKEVENKNLSGFIKLIVLILGFSTGIRDTLTLAAGTCGQLF